MKKRLKTIVQRKVKALEKRILSIQAEKKKWPPDSFIWSCLELTRSCLKLQIELWKSIAPEETKLCGYCKTPLTKYNQGRFEGYCDICEKLAE